MTTDMADDGGQFCDIAVPVLRQRNLFRAKFNVIAGGKVKITQDDQLIELPMTHRVPITCRRSEP